jgi:ribosomal protein S12 methylthiotransferase
VSLVNLGCPKNQVDAEVMLGQLAAAGYQIEDAPEQADLILVNTCSFIREAKEESIQTILEAARFKRTGRCRAVVVSGCLAQRYGQELPGLLPEVDAFVGTGEFPRIADIAAAVLRRSGEDRLRVTGHTALVTADLPRRLLTPGHFAYLKISEGCNRSCTFCAIPDPGPDAVPEPRGHPDGGPAAGGGGVREIVLVSQETTDYGGDRGNPTG